MDVGVLIIIVVVIAAGVGALIWFTTRRRSKKCSGCGRPLMPGQKICPFCQTPVDVEDTVFQHLPTVYLACIGGPRTGQELVLRGDEVHIGRSPDCDIRLEDDLVSWKHAILSYSNGQYVLYDQDSTNGTWVNGQRIAQAVVRPGMDQIRIGPSVFVLKVAGQAVPTPIPQPMATPFTRRPQWEQVHDLGDYELISVLGAGGAATVYKAISKRDRQVEVAIKVLQQSDAYLRQKFQKEIEIGMLLRHPHVVRVYGGGDSQGVLYIVMEYVSGGTLRDQLQPHRPYPLDQTITIVGQVCDALQYAHGMQEGIYHRDIKPENIFFSSDGCVKLGDFGIARLAQSVTRTASGWLIGTPAYMSFEQAKGHTIDGRSDLYSLGVVLYEMVTGRCPFVAENPLAVVDKHIQERPVPPSRINPNVPPQIERAIMRALEKNRDQRFRAAEEMARALGYASPMHHGEAAPAQASLAQAAPVAYPSALPAASGPLRLVRSDGVVIQLNPDVTLLSRRQVNSADMLISRDHARVVYQGQHYWIEDVGSANGTFVNELRIFNPQVLRPGDQIRMGHTLLSVDEG